MATNPSTANQQVIEQLVQLTEAVKQLAERPSARPSRADNFDEADRVRQRVAFGYRALGALTGRESTRSGSEFDVPTVRASRRGDVILLGALPRAADWVELRTGTKVEVVRIHRGDDDDRGADTAELVGAGERAGIVSPRLFDSGDSIGSILVLGGRLGPVLAFGPRLDAVPRVRPAPVPGDTIDSAPDDPSH